jgi:putative salt-induced outer membrane protein
VIALLVASGTAAAQTAPAPAAPTGAPPPDAKALATGPKGPADAPKVDKPTSDSTNVTVSAGGLLTTGNSRTLALTLNSAFDMRRGDNGFGASLLGNYGESAPGAGQPMKASAENIQGRARYDRFFTDAFAGFLIGTGRYDRFQGLSFRLNIDPGVKYIFWKDDVSAFWGELGYDFQYDIRTDSGRIQKDKPELLDRTRADHSARAFVGYRRAFNSDVTFSTGLEYLQSFVKTDLGSADSRLNFNAVLAAKLFEGFSLGVGFNAAYARLPLPGKEQLDTTTTLSLIYGWSDAKPPVKEEPKCPACPEPPPCPTVTPPPPPAALPPAPAPAATPEAPPPSGALAPTGSGSVSVAPPAAPTAPTAPAAPAAVAPTAPAAPAAPVAPAAPKAGSGVTITNTGGGSATVTPKK